MILDLMEDGRGGGELWKSDMRVVEATERSGVSLDEPREALLRSGYSPRSGEVENRRGILECGNGEHGQDHGPQIKKTHGEYSIS